MTISETIMSGLVPSSAVTAEAFGPVRPDVRFPDEDVLVAGAVSRRREEFAAGRSLARQALRRLGYDPVPILRGPSREPVWPEGVVGSITHCPGYCAAAVARRDAILTIGIDAEVDGPLPEGVLSLVALEDERAWIRERAAAGDPRHWDRLLFSAKESVYKAWFPCTRRWLDFDSVRIEFCEEGQTFRATLIDEAFVWQGVTIGRFDGRYAAVGGVLLTAAGPPLEAAHQRSSLTPASSAR